MSILDDGGRCLRVHSCLFFKTALTLSASPLHSMWKDTKSHLVAADRWLSEAIQNPTALAFHHNKELILKSHQCFCLCLFISCSGWLATAIWRRQAFNSCLYIDPWPVKGDKDHIKRTVSLISLVDSRNSIFKVNCSLSSTHSTGSKVDYKLKGFLKEHISQDLTWQVPYPCKIDARDVMLPRAS